MQIDSSRELQLLRELGMELTGAGIHTQVRYDLRALAVGTGRPGIHIWVFIDSSGLRYSCYLDGLREYPTGDPQEAAGQIAAFVRGQVRS